MKRKLFPAAELSKFRERRIDGLFEIDPGGAETGKRKRA
jgi:hypothetical protein